MDGDLGTGSGDPAGASRPRPPAGARLGTRYELGRAIGSGRLGDLFAARDLTTGDDVAVRVLRPDLSADQRLVARLVMSVRRLGAVDDEHLARLRDVVASGAGCALVTDLVPGSPLRQAVRSPVAPADAARLMAHVADGVAALHAAGQAHGDLQAGNVLVSGSMPDVHVRLVDVGLAALVAGRETGGSAARADDVRALGVLLGELLTGQVLDRAPQLSVSDRLPGGLWLLLVDLLAEDPRDRPDAATVSARLRRLSSTGGTRAPWAPPTSGPVPLRPGTGPAPATGPLAAVPTVPVPVAVPVAAPVAPGDPRALDVTTGAPPPAAPRRRRTLGALAVAGLVALAAVSGAAVLLRDDRPAVVTAPSPAPTSPAPVPTPSSTVDPTAQDPTRVAATTTTAPPATAAVVPSTRHRTPSASGRTTTTAARVAPPVPALEWIDADPAAGTLSDGVVRLRVTNVAAGRGTVASITVRSPSEERALTPVPGSAGPYDTTFTGLQNGTSYSFVAEVCNSGGVCSRSAPLQATPYGAPVATAPGITTGANGVTVTWAPLALNGHPSPWTCTGKVTSTLADPSLPVSVAVPVAGGATTFTGVHLSSYTAVESCTDGVGTVSATSPATVYP